MLRVTGRRLYISKYTLISEIIRVLSQNQRVIGRRLFMSSRKLSQFYHGVKGSQVGVCTYQNTHSSECFHMRVLSPSGISEKLITHVFISCSRLFNLQFSNNHWAFVIIPFRIVFVFCIAKHQVKLYMGPTFKLASKYVIVYTKQRIFIKTDIILNCPVF